MKEFKKRKEKMQEFILLTKKKLKCEAYYFFRKFNLTVILTQNSSSNIKNMKNILPLFSYPYKTNVFKTTSNSV